MSLSRSFRSGFKQLHTRTVTHRLPTFAYSARLCSNKPNSDYYGSYKNQKNPANAQSQTPKTMIGTTAHFNPNDTANIFRSFTTYELFKHHVLFSLISSNTLVNLMVAFMENVNAPLAIDTNPEYYKKNITVYDIPGAKLVMKLLRLCGRLVFIPINWLIRKQYFGLFTGGETIDDCVKMADKYCANGIRLIIDNSTEEGLTDEVFLRNFQLKRDLVDTCAAHLSNSVVFMSIKMTALMSPSLLEDMTQILKTQQCTDSDPTPFMSETAVTELDMSLERILDLLKYAKSRNIATWLDAEQFSRQAGMNFVSRKIQAKMNRLEDNKIWVYQTYQNYLVDSNQWIDTDIELSKKLGFKLGVKLVRGAYLEYEAEKAKEGGYPNPIHRSKGMTDDNYNANVEKIVNLIANGEGVGVAVCTHNRESLVLLAKEMNELKVARDHENVYTAQLNGMCDNLTFAASYCGYNALKLIPYGTFDDVWPFLMRRFYENQSIMNASQNERKLYWMEVKRRMNEEKQ